MKNHSPAVGSTAICAETGFPFRIKSDGFSFNYARGPNNEIVSDKGVDVREVRALLDRSLPFGCYLSDDRRVTGWKGNTLGRVVQSWPIKLGRRSWLHGDKMLAVRVVDVHGGRWYGRGSPGVFLNLRPCK